MKDTRSGASYELQNSPYLRYVMAVMTAFSAVTGGLALVQRTLDAGNYGLFLVELIFIIISAGLCIWLLFPQFWKRKRETPVKLDFKPDGKNFYGYEFQMTKFKEVLEAAESDRRDESLLIAVFGTSGVGKSSFLMKCFDGNPNVIHLDLRKNTGKIAEKLKEKLKGKVGEHPQDIFVPQGIEDWLQAEVGKISVKKISTENPLSDTVLILDQFEQIIANDESVDIATALFRTIAPYCLTVIVSIRSDILGNAAGRIRKLIPKPVDVSRRLRLFELCPIKCENTNEQMGLLCKIWSNVMETQPTENMDLLRQLRAVLCGKDGHRTMLPVLAKLAVYAIKSEEIETAKQLKDKTGGKIGNLAEMLLRKECASTTNEDLALRLILSLSNNTGVSEGFTASDLQVICGTGVSVMEVEEILKELDDPIGAVKDVGDKRYTLSHEYLGKLARRNVRKSMQPLEKEQIMVRQSLVKKVNSKQAQGFNAHIPHPYKDLCDVKNRVQLFRNEGLILLSGFLIGISRLFFWSPVGVRVGLDYEFIPAAIAFFGNSFFFWLFYGNVGKAIMLHQETVGKVMWKLTSVAPLVGWVLCCFFPRLWLVIGSGVTLVAALTGLSVWLDAKKEKYKDVMALFKGFSITTFGLIPMFIIFHGTLCLLLQSEYYLYLSSAAATMCLVGQVRNSVHFWHGWFLRDLLARIDLDIPLHCAEELWGARN